MGSSASKNKFLIVWLEKASTSLHTGHLYPFAILPKLFINFDQLGKIYVQKTKCLAFSAVDFSAQGLFQLKTDSSK